MPRKQHEVKVGDIVRFGRIPFKITKLVMDVEKSKQIIIEEENTLQRAVI
jgi:hypothetical protein